MASKENFKTLPGQVDYSNARWAPVINSVVLYKNKILIVKRSPSLRFYPDHWNGISGFLDDDRSLKEKVLSELKEETGMGKNCIKAIKLGNIFDQEAPEFKKTWIVHPVLVKVKTDKIKLDWEAKEYKWVTPKKAEKHKLVPGFEKVIESFKLLK